jgi:hypothetical protein
MNKPVEIIAIVAALKLETREIQVATLGWNQWQGKPGMGGRIHRTEQLLTLHNFLSKMAIQR